MRIYLEIKQLMNSYISSCVFKKVFFMRKIVFSELTQLYQSEINKQYLNFSVLSYTLYGAVI